MVHTVQEGRYFRAVGQEVLRRTRVASGGLDSSRARLFAESGPGMVTRKQRNRSHSLSGRPFKLRSHLKRMVDTPRWSEIGLFQCSSLLGHSYFSPTESPIINAKMPSNTTTITMIIINFFRA